MLDINGAEFVVLVLLAVLLIGPERLPGYAAQLAGLVKRGKVMLRDAKERVDTELGPEMKDVDWSRLDPRQYDPRRIVREALLDDDEEPPARRTGAAAGAASATASTASAPTTTPDGASAGADDRPPFDDEAT